MMAPKQIVTDWVAAFNRRDAAAAAVLYHLDAINIQVALCEPIKGFGLNHPRPVHQCCAGS
jgi:ketosteroid isomerase-like protein